MSEQILNKIKSRDEIAAAYKSEPWWYDLRGFFILTFAYNDTLSSQLKFFGPHFGKNHLEVACGTGTLLNLLLLWRKWRGFKETFIVGIDYAPAMLAGAEKRFKGQKNMQFIHADAAQMPLTENCFDTINIANSIHCLPDVDSALKEICRVLKTEGSFAANVLLYPRGTGLLSKMATKINLWGIKKGILVTPYSESEIAQKFQAAGFKIVSFDRRGNCGNFLLKK